MPFLLIATYDPRTCVFVILHEIQTHPYRCCPQLVEPQSKKGGWIVTLETFKGFTNVCEKCKDSTLAKRYHRYYRNGTNRQGEIKKMIEELVKR